MQLPRALTPRGLILLIARWRRRVLISTVNSITEAMSGWRMRPGRARAGGATRVLEASRSALSNGQLAGEPYRRGHHYRRYPFFCRPVSCASR